MTSSTISSRSTTDADLIGSATPRIWTPRTAAPTRTAALEAVGEMAGIDLWEWQRNAVDVALEYDPSTGKWIRRLVTILVARQNGKTWILESRILFGLFVVPDDKLILHTAQDRAVPRELFESLVTRIGDSKALHRRVAKIRETNGQEQIKLKDGSRYRILAPRPKAFRTWPCDVLIFDEAREQHDTDLWGAAYPTQRSRPNPQAWVVSNAGDPDSVVLNGLRDRGRLAADDPSTDPRIAYLEWSAPEDAALDDPAGWVAANPALGTSVTPADIRDELLALDENAFRTEILCQWVTTITTPAIDAAKWHAAAGTPDAVEPGIPRPVAGIHISGDRTYAALAIAAERNERLVVDLVDEWADPDGVDVLAIARDTVAWMKAHRIREIGYDRAATSIVAQHVTRKNWEAHRIDTVEYVTASQNLVDAINTGYLIHRSNPSLDAQVAAAGRQDRKDGTSYISAAHSSGEIAGVLALAFAVSIAYRPRRGSSVHNSETGA